MKALLHYILSRIVHLKGVSDVQPAGILVNVSAGIGDAIMAEPLLRALRRHFPSSRLAVLCSPATLGLFSSHPAVHQIIVMPDSWHSRFRMMIALRRARFDVYIGAIPSNTLRHVMLPFLAGIRLRFKHATPHRGSQDFDFLFHAILPLDTSRHRVVANLDLLKLLHAEPLVDGPRIDIEPALKSRIRNLLLNAGWTGVQPLIGFHAGCNPVAVEKRWDPLRFAEVGRYLADHANARILLIGGPDELEENRVIADQLGSVAINLVGQLNLMESAAAIQHCAFFLSNDSGIMHLSTAAGTPTFAVFGPKDERHIGPFGKDHVVIRCGPRVNDVQVTDVIRILQESENGLKRLQGTS